MKPDESLRLLVENRSELLSGIAERMSGPGARYALVDCDGASIEGSESVQDGTTVRELEIERYGRLRMVGSASLPDERSALRGAVSALLASCVESEMELSQLLDDHIATTDQLMALFNILFGTHETWKLGDKLKVLVEEAGRQCRAAVSIIVEAEEGDECRHLWTDDPDEGDIVDDVVEHALQEEQAHIGTEPRPHLWSPIVLHGQNAGWFLVVSHEDGEPFTNRHLKLVQALADLAAGFILTSRLQEKVVSNLKVDRELELASQIQELLIPRHLPTVAKCDLSAACKPASQIGGDFYAVKTFENGDLVFALGDVTGKGVPAALLMAMTRTAFYSLSDAQAAPAQIVERLNEVLYEDLGRVEKFVTLVVGRFHQKERRVALANAGHSPVIFVPIRSGMGTTLEPALPPVGVVPVLQAEPVLLQLGPGSMLVITSDGVTEARNPESELFGTDRLLDVLTEDASGTSEQLVRRIFTRVSQFARGAPQSDDQTIIVLRGAA